MRNTLAYCASPQPEGLRLRAIGRIKSLTKLNGSPVTEGEATAALRMAAGSRVSQVSLLALSRTDTERPRSLSLALAAQVLTQTSRNKPDRGSEQDNLWYAKVRQRGSTTVSIATAVTQGIYACFLMR